MAARTGTPQRWRNPTSEGDDVQRSIELLDKVLSEYDENETEGDGGAGSAICGSSNGEAKETVGVTPDDESPSLGNQSEDDGYMSMNGRKAKMALLALRPVQDCPEPQDNNIVIRGNEEDNYVSEFPPPPEEAERLISTLLPMVSPGSNSTTNKRNSKSFSSSDNSSSSSSSNFKASSSRNNKLYDRQKFIDDMDDKKVGGHVATTQTTLPKTRHQRPYGWENGSARTDKDLLGIVDGEGGGGGGEVGVSSASSKFASLPYDGKVTFNWIPPRTNPGAAVEKHREVRRRSSEEVSTNVKNRKKNSNAAVDTRMKTNKCSSFKNGDSNFGESMNSSSTTKENNMISFDNRSVCVVENTDKDRASLLRKQRQNEIVKSSSVEDRLLMNRKRSDSCDNRRRNNSDSSEGRLSRYSESERSSIPRSSSVSVERFSVRANCDSSDFSRANSTNSNDRFNSDFSIAVASVGSSNDRASVPTSDPFSIRNLDFSFSLPSREESVQDPDDRFSAVNSEDRFSTDHERYSDLFSNRMSDFSTRNSVDFRTQSEEEEHFSDDSLEELLPPPQQQIGKRHSIAWEVSLEDDHLYAPGSTKVVGRRRRKSSDLSSVGSASKMRDFDDWPDPPLSATEDDLVSPYSDSSTNDLDQIKSDDLTKNGTYVIRRGRKKERKLLPKTTTATTKTKTTKSKSFDYKDESKFLLSSSSEVGVGAKRYSNTFDDIKSILKEGRLDSFEEPPPPDFASNFQPELVRVVSMPVINNDNCTRNQLEITVEEEEIVGVGLSSSSSSSELSANNKYKLTDDYGNKMNKRKKLSTSLNCGGRIARNIESKEDNYDLNNEDKDLPSAGAAASSSSSMILSMSKSMDAKIPVNLLIEDQIVKKALNENRRQLEKVSDAIKEIENVKNSESYDKRKRILDIKNNSRSYDDEEEEEEDDDDDYRNPVNIINVKKEKEKDENEEVLFVVDKSSSSVSISSGIVNNVIDNNIIVSGLSSSINNRRTSGSARSKNNVTGGVVVVVGSSSNNDSVPYLENTKLNCVGSSSSDENEFYEFRNKKQISGGVDVYKSSSCGRRIRKNIGNDQNKQIENVIDAILEDSKNPEFQVSVEVLEFPPLPPSPVEEADEESSDAGIGASTSPKTTTTTTTTSVAGVSVVVGNNKKAVVGNISSSSSSSSSTSSASNGTNNNNNNNNTNNNNNNTNNNNNLSNNNKKNISNKCKTTNHNHQHHHHHHQGNKTVDYRPRVPPHRSAIDNQKDYHSSCSAGGVGPVPPSSSSSSSTTTGQVVVVSSSLNTRSMDAGFSRVKRTAAGTPSSNSNSTSGQIFSSGGGSGSRREVPAERRTLPTDLPGPSRRRPFAKWNSPSSSAADQPSQSTSSGTTGMQTSCSLPETPVFARGTDIPRTPQHAGCNNGQQTRRQPGWYAPTTATTGGYRRNNLGLEQAIIGTELLRLAGGPNRGWYPTRKGNQPRPASIEHLERLNNAYEARLPGSGEQQRKPLTLPTNITPNKYFGQSSKHSGSSGGSASSTREALRRVTSLLIKKGGESSSGSGSGSGVVGGGICGNSSNVGVVVGSVNDAPKKKGFFKNFWKRSRHYSLENQ